MALLHEAQWLNGLTQTDFLSSEWKPRRVLGQGGQGIVGLWEHKIDNRQIAVKQASYSPNRPGLLWEANILAMLRPTKSVHIPHMIGEMEAGIGSGDLSTAFNAGPVHRMKLEYCPGGTLLDWFTHRWSYARYQGGSKFIDEKSIWEIFHCLARAVLVIHHGSEDPTASRWGHGEICHFDLKLENVLIGGPLTDAEHKKKPPFKIADFGSSVEVTAEQDAAYNRAYNWAGTRPWVLPEQGKGASRTGPNRPEFKRPWLREYGGIATLDPKFFRNLNYTPNGSHHYGSPSNIWQLGLIMWCLIKWRWEPDWSNDNMCLYRWDASDILSAGGWTVGDDRDRDTADKRNVPRSRYSEALRVTVAECLLVEQSSRIDPRTLFNKTKQALEQYQKDTLHEFAVGVPMPASASPPQAMDADIPEPDAEQPAIPVNSYQELQRAIFDGKVQARRFLEEESPDLPHKNSSAVGFLTAPGLSFLAQEGADPFVSQSLSAAVGADPRSSLEVPPWNPPPNAFNYRAGGQNVVARPAADPNTLLGLPSANPFANIPAYQPEGLVAEARRMAQVLDQRFPVQRQDPNLGLLPGVPALPPLLGPAQPQAAVQAQGQIRAQVLLGIAQLQAQMHGQPQAPPAPPVGLVRQVAFLADQPAGRFQLAPRSQRIYYLRRLPRNMLVHNVKDMLHHNAGCPIQPHLQRYMNGDKLVTNSMTVADLVRGGNVVTVTIYSEPGGP